MLHMKSSASSKSVKISRGEAQPDRGATMRTRAIEVSRRTWLALALAACSLRPPEALAQTAPPPPPASAQNSQRGATPRQPLMGALTLRDAVQRGLEYNLRIVGL